jgi:hypothetical protein
MDAIGWLLEGDPAIRWQVLRDLQHAPAPDVAAERARVEHEGWGARLLALTDPGGLWDGGACFPASHTGGEPGQPWTATMHTDSRRLLRPRGDDPGSVAGDGFETGSGGDPRAGPPGPAVDAKLGIGGHEGHVSHA